MNTNSEMDLSGFTVSMAIMDAVPVFLFGGTCILIALLFHSPLFLIGACLCLLAGFGKVLWKLIIAIKKQNVMWLNRQFTYVMVLGFTCMAISIVIGYQQISFSGIWNAMVESKAIILFAIGIIGIIIMAMLGKVLDYSARANWMEQITNSAAQLAFFLGMLILVVR